MALNCEGCTRKHDAQSGKYCESFHMAPQLDDCQLHSKYAKPSTPVLKPNDRPGYIWLNKNREQTSN